MTLCLKVEKKYAQSVHGFLSEKNLLSKEFRPNRDSLHVFFPISKRPTGKELKSLKSIYKKLVISNKTFEVNTREKITLHEALSEKLSKKELELVNRAFDVVGNIAIVEIPKGLEKKEKLIGQAILETQKGVETVCKKTGAHKGVFRAEPVKIIAGKKNLNAVYRESGCVFRVKLGKVFFSPRLSAERLRIAKQVKKGEVVAALFAGVGPFPIVLAKNSLMEKAFAVELNPHAVKQLEENIHLNKVETKVVALLGDVKKLVPKKLVGLCDRVLMPLPKGAQSFLPQAIDCLKKEGGIIHFYSFGPKDNPFEESINAIKLHVKQKGLSAKILDKRELRSYSPQTVQVVIDFRVY